MQKGKLQMELLTKTAKLDCKQRLLNMLSYQNILKSVVICIFYFDAVLDNIHNILLNPLKQEL